jgi:FkbM family methyltransferase
VNISNLIANTPPLLRRHRLIEGLLWAFPDSNIQILQFNGKAKAFIDLSDANARQYLIKETFEPEFFAIATPFLSNGGTFFDVGANFGLCSFGLMTQLQNKTVDYHLFEANKHLLDLLSRSASFYQNNSIHINNCCVSDVPGISKLNIVNGQLGQSFISASGLESVPNLTIDDYVQTNNIKTITLMKMDIEGHEPLALKGAVSSLRKGLIDAIYLEVSTINLARGSYSPADCFDLLLDCGFKLYYCKPVDLQEKRLAEKTFSAQINGQTLPLAHLENHPGDYQTDILAIRPNLTYFRELG